MSLVVALLGALGGLLTALCAVITILSARNARKLDQVHSLVNSNFSAVSAQLEKSQEDNKRLEAMVDRLLIKNGIGRTHEREPQ